MSGRRRGLFGGRKGGFSVVPRKPVSLMTKLIFLFFFCQALLMASAIYTSIHQKNEITVRLFGGAGVLCLYIGILAFIISIKRIRWEGEPVIARIFAMIVSLLSLVSWGFIYFLGWAGI